MPTSHPLFATMKVKENFFDRRKVQKTMDETRRRALNRIGYFIMSDARESIRFRKNPKLASPTGAPPFSHERSKKDKDGKKTAARFKMIFYAYDESRDSVVSGQLAFGRSGGTTVPEAHEMGEDLTISTNRGQRGSERNVYRPMRVQYPERPYMWPALKRNQSKILAMWQWGWGRAI